MSAQILKSNNKYIITLFAVIALISTICLMKPINKHGLGVSPDSMAYMAVANHIAHGKGVSIYLKLYSDKSDPIAAWPPAIPAIYALFIFIKSDLFISALLMNMISFGLILYMIQKSIYLHSNRIVISLISSLIFYFHPLFKGYFAWMLSEPIYLLFIICELMCISQYLITNEKKYYWLTAIFAGLLPLIRYVGAAYIGCAVVIMFLHDPRKLREKLYAHIGFVALSITPLLIWMIRNTIQLKSIRPPGTSNFALMFGSLIKSSDHLKTIWINYEHVMVANGSWIQHFFTKNGSPSISFWCGTLMFLISLMVMVMGYFRFKKQQSHSWLLIHLTALFSFGYTLFLIISLIIASFIGDVPERYLVSSFTTGVWSFCLLMGVFLNKINQDQKLAGKVASSVCCIIFLLWAFSANKYTRNFYDRLEQFGPDQSRGGRIERARNEEWFATPEIVKKMRPLRQYEAMKQGRYLPPPKLTDHE